MRDVVHAPKQPRKRPGLAAARAALLVGVLYAAVSVMWGLGYTWLLDTVGGKLESSARAGSAATKSAVWAAVLVKLIGAVLPLSVVRPPDNVRLSRWLRVLTWLEAVVLIGYGLVLTVVGLLVQAHVVHTNVTADHRALAWHAYLWDPWFLVWGLLVLLVVRQTRAGGAAEETARVSDPQATPRT